MNVVPVESVCLSLVRIESVRFLVVGLDAWMLFDDLLNFFSYSKASLGQRWSRYVWRTVVTSPVHHRPSFASSVLTISLTFFRRTLLQVAEPLQNSHETAFWSGRRGTIWIKFFKFDDSQHLSQSLLCLCQLHCWCRSWWRTLNLRVRRCPLFSWLFQLIALSLMIDRDRVLWLPYTEIIRSQLHAKRAASVDSEDVGGYQRLLSRSILTTSYNETAKK